MPRWDDLSPFNKPESSAQWRDAGLLAGIEAKIADLASKEHVTRLLLVCDRYRPCTVQFPAAPVMDQLLADLTKNLPNLF